jgi:hypothetical protein
VLALHAAHCYKEITEPASLAFPSSKSFDQRYFPFAIRHFLLRALCQLQVDRTLIKTHLIQFVFSFLFSIA